MSFNWLEYQEISDDILASAKTSPFVEACYRAAISRSYYAVFNIAKKFVVRNYNSKLQSIRTHYKTMKKSIGSHEIHIQVFEQSTDRTEKKIGTELKRLKNMRVQADYEASPNIQEDDAILQFVETEDTLKLLKTIGAY